MNTFKAFFILEFKQLFLSKRKWIVMGILLLICFFLVQVGIWQYRDIGKEKETFRELERKKVEQIVNWDQYGLYGFHLFFMPSSLSTLFFNSNNFTELTCHIDSGEKLNTFSLFRGKKIFEEKPGKLMDFSGIILILGSFIALFYGLDAFRYTEYIKSIASMHGHRQTFLYIWLSRVFLLCVFLIGVTFIAALLLVINGIKIKGDGLVHLSVFFLIMLMMQVFFLTLGTLARSFRSALIAGIFIILSWILFVYIIPAGLNKIVEAKANKMPSYYQVELDKLKILMDFERKERELTKQLNLLGPVYKDMIEKEITKPTDFWKRIDDEERRKEAITQGEKEIFEKIDKLKESDLTIDVIKQKIGDIYGKLYKEWEEWKKYQPERARGYLKKEFPKIEKKEKALLDQMKAEVNFFQRLFSIFPTTFYLSTGNEIGSRGYANIITFYEKAIGIKKEFMGFYLAHRYGPNSDEIVNFIEEFKEKEKGEKEANIYKATSGLPGKFVLGIGATLLWILAFLLLSHLSYKRALFRPPRKQIVGLNDLEIDLVEGRSDVMLSSEKDIGNHLYNVLSGKNRVFKGTVKWRDDDIAAKNIKVNFVYLCHIEELPGDIKAKDFVLFIGKGLNTSKGRMQSIKHKLGLDKIGRMSFGQLSDKEKAQILLEAVCLKTNDIYMINNYLKGMPSDFPEEFKTRVEELKGKKGAILYLTNDVFMGRRLGDRLTFLKTEAALASVKW